MTYSCGYRTVNVGGGHGNENFPMMVMYPALSPEKTEALGPYRLDVSADAPVADGTFSLVLISHGSGGSPILYRLLARHLARNGFIVGMPEHPCNNRLDNSLEGTVEILIARPRHLHNAAVWFYGNPEFTERLKPDTLHVAGHSLGGYTALALAGGVPTPFPEKVSELSLETLDVQKDSRVKSLVLLAPATVWFRGKKALQDVHAPILMFFGDQDEETPYAEHGRPLLEGLPKDTDICCRIVKNGGHFSFLGPYPETMAKPSFLPSQDPPGFDRAAFHDRLNAEVLEFLRKYE